MKKYNLEEITVTKVEGVVYENSDNTGFLYPTVKPFKDIIVKPEVSQGSIIANLWGYAKLNFAFADANNTIDGIDGLTEPGFRIDFGIDVVIAVDVTGSMQSQAS